MSNSRKTGFVLRRRPLTGDPLGGLGQVPTEVEKYVFPSKEEAEQYRDTSGLGPEWTAVPAAYHTGKDGEP